jgi:hypothetical protein
MMDVSGSAGKCYLLSREAYLVLVARRMKVGMDW